MSYLSTTENVGFSGIPQNISDTSCATQYKMAVESVPANCNNEVNMFIHDSSGDEQTYISHLNDNFFHTKFKIDPNELYTFHDTDVIAGEITVSHTEESLVFPDNIDVKNKLNFLDSPSKELDIIESFSNGDIKEECKEEVISNGHYSIELDKLAILKHEGIDKRDGKAQKGKNQSSLKEKNMVASAAVIKRLNIPTQKNQINVSNLSNINSINSVNTNHINSSNKVESQTFLDVFKREQCLVQEEPPEVKTEPLTSAKPPAKKTSAAKPSQSKARRGRGPAVHEALQRIPVSKRAIPLPNRAWHAPDEQLFDCGPLNDRKLNPFKAVETSSSDDDNMLDFEAGVGPVSVEEGAAETRSVRMALRRAALRRHASRAYAGLKLANNFKEQQALVVQIKKQISGQKSSRVPTQTINQILALRGMPAVFSSHEKRKLREIGWSGGESSSVHEVNNSTCAGDGCSQSPLPCARYCLSHVTLAPEQRLYAACAAVFAGGERCKQPLLPLQEETPLCPEHAWKRDNYDKLSRDRDCKPRRVSRRPPPSTAGGSKRPRRRRRPARAPPPRPHPPPPLPPSASHSLAEINVCSNSSAYDSSEETVIGGLSESEFIVATTNSHELEVGEVGHVPPDDILDPAVLSQIPDEAFTEFFNQGGNTFAEGSELAAALEAVLDERALDTISDCVFPTSSSGFHATTSQAIVSHVQRTPLPADRNSSHNNYPKSQNSSAPSADTSPRTSS